MDGINAHVLRGFGLKCRYMAKNKSFYVCGTDRGMKAVSKTGAEHSAITFRHRVKEALFESGFTGIDRFCLSVQDQPFLVFENETYTVTDYYDYPETRFDRAEEFTAAVAAAARMHAVFKTAGLEFGEAAAAERLRDVYIKNTADLERYKKNLQKQKRLSDFDVLFLKNCVYYSELLGRWFRQAEKSRYYTDGLCGKYLSHNRLKEETVLRSPAGEVYVTDFSECAPGHYANDLASLVKRHFMAAPAGTAAGLDETVGLYVGINPLDKDELQGLYCNLLFPEKFLRLCSRYYTKRRTWTPGGFGLRMEDIVSHIDGYEEYLSGFQFLR